jgi:hypothetical protein
MSVGVRLDNLSNRAAVREAQFLKIENGIDVLNAENGFDGLIMGHD